MKYHFALDSEHSGCACFLTIFSYYKIKPIVRDNILDSQFDYHLMIEIAEKTGFQVRVLNNIDNSSLIASYKNPFIIFNQKEKKWYVSIRVKRDRLLVFDPCNGKKLLLIDDLLNLDNDVLYLFFIPQINVLSNKKDSMLKMFLNVFWPLKKEFAITCISSFLLIIFGLLSSYYFKFVVDDIMFSRSVDTVIILSVGILIVTLFNILTNSIRNYIILYINQRISLHFSLEYFKYVINLPLFQFIKLKSGDILSRMDDIEDIKTALSEIFITLFMNMFMVICISGFLIIQSYKLFLIAFFTSVISLLVMLLLKNVFSRYSKERAIKNSIAKAFVIESISNFKTIRASNVERSVNEQFKKKQFEAMNISYKYNLLFNIHESLLDLLENWGFNIIFFVGCIIVINNNMSLGGLISFNALLALYFTPFKSLINIQPGIQAGIVAANRISEIIKLSNNTFQRDNIKLAEINSTIAIKNLFFGYSDNLVLDNINLIIKKGQIVTLVGKSGCGKTTLLQLIVRFYNSVQGKIKIDDINIDDIDATSIRNRIGYLPQDFTIISGTIAENISFFRNCYSRKNIIDAAILAGAHSFIDEMPERYDTVLCENGSSLSGGQKQKIALARVLLGNHDLYLFDEPTNNLDLVSELYFNNMVKKLKNQNKTIIIVSHKTVTTINSDKICVMLNGKIVEEGTHMELLGKKGYYSKLVNEK